MLVNGFMAAHQPNFVPWLPWFLKLSVVEQPWLLDCAKFSKGSFTNRCEHTLFGRQALLTVPVSAGLGMNIDQVPLASQFYLFPERLTRFGDSLPSSLPGKALLKEIFLDFAKFVESEKPTLLLQVNLWFVSRIQQLLGIDLRTKSLSKEAAIPEGHAGSEILASIMRQSGMRRYLSGPNLADYAASNFFEEFEVQFVSNLFPEMECRNTLDFIGFLGPAARDVFLDYRDFALTRIDELEK